MDREIRVIQYGIGPIGAGIVRLLLDKRNVKIVGAIDIDPGKVGKDLGEVVEAGRTLGVTVSQDAGAVLAGGADVVIHSTSSLLTDVAAQLIDCVSAKLHVISTCEELSFPFGKHPELSRTLDEAARKNHAVLTGVGVNPGYAMDKLVLTLAAVSTHVDHASALRVVNASTRRRPLQEKIGAGLTVEEFTKKMEEGAIKHHGLPESAAMVARGLGFAVDEFEENIQPMVANEPVATEFLKVEPGQVAGVHQVATAFANGIEKVHLELKMYVGAKDPGDSVWLKGKPELHLHVEGIHGDLATAAVAVNCIPAVLQTPPGLRTAADLSMGYLP